ncbi:two-component system response regulator ArcA [Echinimonas agarilytica]|uniref:Two-component system response regulator ArcA n=1 Tax=Echinimonas agarilytica TaxID=1215918 RepID=A0AA41W944_9GAMM|nr:two-component system response regulator ArcA [Echinimonas agarilytica]MCM2681365.1 two-component system response regulator ArcA [Echinimonas agarilytica]
MDTPHILIVEDETVTRTTLQHLFEAEGYSVLEATDGEEMHQQLLKNKDIHLVIMDINLPGKNGLLLARELREQKDVALMFLTGRDNEVDKILGLEIGADDYITKPFNPRELTIRARNLLTRTMTSHSHQLDEEVAEYKFNGWQLDVNSRSLNSPSGESFKLPRSEYRALEMFIQNPGKILTRGDLLRRMTGRDLRPNDRTVDVTIRRIRKHFESVPSTAEIISTIHGEGYRFTGELEVA